MEEPDPAAIRAAARGDVVAFEAVVRAYQVPVWRFLRHLLGDESSAEDVTQETFLRLYQRMETFRFRSRFSTWVFQIARNAGIDALRSRQRRERLASAAAVADVVVPAPEQRIELDVAIDSLSPKLREALLVVEVLGFGYRDAGVVLGIPEGTVKSRVFHAREQLVAWHRDTDSGEGRRRAL